MNFNYLEVRLCIFNISTNFLENRLILAKRHFYNDLNKE